MAKEEGIDWLGEGKHKKGKRKSKSKPLFNFLSIKPNTKLFPGFKQNKRRETISFLKPVKVNSFLSNGKKFKSSEELLYGKRKLNRFGDFDMDGSPNIFDCSPWKVNKDAKKIRKKKREPTITTSTSFVTKGLAALGTGIKKGAVKVGGVVQKRAEKAAAKEYGQYKWPREYAPGGAAIIAKVKPGEEVGGAGKGFGSIMAQEREQLKAVGKRVSTPTKEEMINKRLREKIAEYEDTGKEVTKKIGEKLYSEARKELKGYKQEVGYTGRTKEILKEYKKASGKKYITEEEYRRAQEQAEKELIAVPHAEEKVKRLKAQTEEGGRFFGELGKLKRREDLMKQQIAEGHAPSLFEIRELEEAKKRYEDTHAFEALKHGRIPSAKAVIATAKAAEWSPAARKMIGRVDTAAVGILNTFLSQSPPKTGSFYNKSVGRPKGSYKNYIPGVGNVDIYTFRKWNRQQKALQRMQGQLPEQSPEYQMRQEIAAQEAAQELEPAQAGLSDQGNYDNTTYQAPHIYDTANLPPDQARDMKSREQAYQRGMYNQGYDRAMGRLQQQQFIQPALAAPPLSIKAIPPLLKNEKQITQYNMQVGDNIMHAPNIQRGDLVGGGQNPFTYTPPEGNVLNAPNILLGQMRNVDMKGREIPAVRLSPSPIPNPKGEQYTDIDPISGRVALKNRINEKWLTGEAL